MGEDMSEDMGREMVAQQVASEVTLGEQDMPPLYHDADKRSIQTQRLYFDWLKWELIFLGGGVLVGAFSGVTTQLGPVSLLLPPFTIFSFHISTLNAFEVAEAVLLAVALILRVLRLGFRPDRLWYEARAVAESVKSIAWRYAVGGEPFQIAATPETLDAVIGDRFKYIQDDLTKYKAPDAVRQRHQITPGMDAVRALSLEARKRLYRQKRVDDQQAWYSRKSAFNRSRALWTHGTLIAIEFLAIFAAFLPLILAALHIFPLNLQSLMANIAGGGAAWMQAKRYEDLEVSYKVTSSELRKVDSDIAQQVDEVSWAHFVENVEGSMSREHQLWRATRTN